MIRFKRNNNIYMIYFDKKFFITPLISKSNASRYIAKESLSYISWLGIIFAKIQTNYDDLIHIYLDTNADKSEYSQNIWRFIGVLKKIVFNLNHPYWESKPEFKVNYKDGKFYVSGKRDWFTKMHLGSLLTYTYPEYYLSDEEMLRFPAY